MSIAPRMWIKASDRFRHNSKVRHATAKVLLATVPRLSPESDQLEVVQSVATLCRIARLSQRKSFTSEVEGRIRERVLWLRGRPIDWSAITGDFRPGRIEKGVVLKPYIGPREKGVVLISFEYQWARLMSVANLDEFARRYTLITAPTWSPPHALENVLFADRYPGDRIYTLLSNAVDTETFPRLSPKFRPLPLYASNWVNADLYTPVPFEKKDIDILMVANFGEYKRHFVLFDALRELPRDFRVVLIGQPVGIRTAARLRDEARTFGVANRFELLESVPDKTVVDSLCRAKVSVILSKQEGSCVAVMESLIANTPVGMFEDAIVGSKIFIDENSGRLLRSSNLAAQLGEFVEQANRYSPRNRVLEQQLDSDGSTRRLNSALRDQAVAEGEEWTRDIVAHHWRPDPAILCPEDLERLRPEYVHIRETYGVAIGKT